jgi:hypothetical protein
VGCSESKLLRRGSLRRTRITTGVIVGALVALVVVAGVDALRSSDSAAPPTRASTTTVELPEISRRHETQSPVPTAAGVGPVESAPMGRLSRMVRSVSFSFRVRTTGWESFGRISINKSTVGPQSAEAIIFWTSYPDGDRADPCANLRSPPVGPSTADLARAVATAPGTKLLTGPSDVTIGGQPAKHVVLTVRESVGCDPGFFYTWHDADVGALWGMTGAGDTISVWLVDVEGKRLFIEAETTKQAGADLEREIQQIVESIRFD